MPLTVKLQVAKATPQLRGHDHYWRVILELTEEGRTFTTADIADRSSPGYGAEIRDFLRRLAAGGVIRATETFATPGTPGRIYELVKRQRATPSFNRDGSPAHAGARQQQMWNVMRRETGGWTLQELVIAASTEDVTVTSDWARRYCVALTAAGILIETGRPGDRRWRLKGTANTGPQPPMRMSGACVFDPNTGAVVGDLVVEGDRP